MILSLGKRLVGVGVCALVYLAACASPAIIFESGGVQRPWPGVQALLMGWMGLLSGQLAWLANFRCSSRGRA